MHVAMKDVFRSEESRAVLPAGGAVEGREALAGFQGWDGSRVAAHGQMAVRPSQVPASCAPLSASRLGHTKSATPPRKSTAPTHLGTIRVASRLGDLKLVSRLGNATTVSHLGNNKSNHAWVTQRLRHTSVTQPLRCTWVPKKLRTPG
jgi:hypothetical protein